MSFLGVIGLVVALIFYVARSVEKQNAEAARRRAQMRGKRPVSAGQKSVRSERPADQLPDERPVPAEPVEQTAGGNTMMQSYQRALEQSRRTSPPRTGSTVPPSRPVSSHSNRDPHPFVLLDRQVVRQAFIFSECIGRPRSLNPHPWFRNKK